jgi:ATP-dependent helicase HrpB
MVPDAHMDMIDNENLPVDRHLSNIVEGLRKNNRVWLRAETGAGKTTRVPWALWSSALMQERQIWVLQPRRLAACLSAERVAHSLGENVGQGVGYHVRQDRKIGPETRLVYLTDGMFLRRALANPRLEGIACVIIDEFHERSVAMDLALLFVRRLQATSRPDLKLVVMSATMLLNDLEPYLAPCLGFDLEGRLYPVEVHYQAPLKNAPVASSVMKALQDVLSTNASLKGDVLIFLPGAGDIYRAMAHCEALSERYGVDLYPLHANLSSRQQMLALRRGDRPRVIFSTNVAETSITVPGVDTVIDCGLVKVPSFDPVSGLGRLSLQKHSQASAQQRAGRAGRLRPGKVVRLFSKTDYQRRKACEKADIESADLSEALIWLAALKLQPEDVPWLQKPPKASLDRSRILLSSLGAINAKGRLTETGTALASLPVHPRLGKIALEGQKLGVGKRATWVAAFLHEQSLDFSKLDLDEASRSDLLLMEDYFHKACRSSKTNTIFSERGETAVLGHRINKTSKQLQRQLKCEKEHITFSEDSDERVLKSILAGYPDRVAHGRVGKGHRHAQQELQLATGPRLKKSPTSSVINEPWVVVVAGSRTTSRGRSGDIALLLSAIEPDWLLDLENTPVHQNDTLYWNDTLSRVEFASRLMYGMLILDESKEIAKAGKEASGLLLKAVMERGIESTVMPKALQRYAALNTRLNLFSKYSGEEIPETLEFQDVLRDACEGRVSLAQLREYDFYTATLSRFPSSVQRHLEAYLPTQISLGRKKTFRVHYEEGKNPWVASYLQDFFGLREGPYLCDGRLPLTLHLWAPNRRAVQVTSDLAGFWERHYPQLRPGLSRRYPKHDWPSDPISSQPPPPSGRYRR